MESTIEHFPSVLVYIGIVVCVIAYLFLFTYVSPLLSNTISGYRMLSEGKKIEWDSRVISNVNSLLASGICIYALLFSDEISKDLVWGYSGLVLFGCSIVIGFLTADLILILRYYQHVGEVFYLFHHVASIYAYFCVVTYQAYYWFANLRMLAEVSTPFVNQRWFLDILGHKRNSKLYVANGLIMTFAFFAVRIATIPPYWYRVWLIYGSKAVQESGYLWYVMTLSPLILDPINFFWMAKILKGAKKVLFAKEKAVKAE